MIRNLKVLLAAALALAAFGALSAPGVQAAEFHCSIEPCRFTAHADETIGTATAHHVLNIENATTTESLSITCPELTGEGTMSHKTESTGTLENIVYVNTVANPCRINGSTGVEIVMNGCKYRFVASTGAVEVLGCNAGKEIEVKITGGCVFFVGPQTAKNTVSYHNNGISGTNSTELTVSTGSQAVHIQVVVTKNGSCGAFIAAPNPLVGTYLTGNTRVTAEEDIASGGMVEGWWV